jgi:hypothetical protein
VEPDTVLAVIHKCPPCDRTETVHLDIEVIDIVCRLQSRDVIVNATWSFM